VIDGLRPYPSYTDSGIEWLGEVPAHWDVRKLRNVLTRVTERNQPDLPLLSVVREKGVIQRDTTSTSKDENHNFIPDDLSNYKVVRAGQFAVNKMKAWQGSYGVSHHDGIVSPAYFVFDLSGVGGEFFHSAIRSRAYVPFFTQASDGVRIGQWDLAQARMNEIPFVVPPVSEQAAVVRFVAYADGRIRRSIRAKQKLIKLLQEQKQVVIHQAVTRGCDPNASMKESGVEWLGVVPEHWEVTRLGRIIKLATGFPFKSEGFSQDESDIRLLRGINVASGRIRWDEVVRWPAVEKDDLREYELREGDVVFGMDRPFVRAGTRVAKVGVEDVPSLLLQRVARIRPHAELNVDFALMVLRGPSFLDYLSPIFTGISVPHVSPDQIRSFRLALPPIEEQSEIVERVKESTNAIDVTADAAVREIDLLREFRARLIADVVTGRVDVREAAAPLPDDADESNALDESDPRADEEIDLDLDNTDDIAEESLA
jgi:type I restriction enzyme S subunit